MRNMRIPGYVNPILLYGLGFIVLQIFSYVMVSLFFLALSWYSSELAAVPDFVLFVLGQALFYSLVFFFYFSKNKKPLIFFLSKPRLRIGLMRVIHVTIFIMAFCLISTVLFSIIGSYLPQKWIRDNQFLFEMPTFILILFAGFIGPFVEELFFRGLFFRKIRRFFSIPKALILTSLIFGLVHLDILQSSNAFLMGIVLNLIYVRYRSGWLTSWAHMVFNLTSILLVKGEGFIWFLEKAFIPFLVLGVYSFYFVIRELKSPEGAGKPH